MSHAILPPSSAHVWRHCSTWLRANQRNSHGLSKDTDSSTEGTAAHWAVAEILQGRQVSEGLVTPEGFVLTAEIVIDAEYAASEMLKLINRDVPYESEQTLAAIPEVLTDLVWGTPDLSQLDGNIVRIVDFKYGRSHVPAIDNEQLICYGVLRLAHQARKRQLAYGALDNKCEFEFSIVQPRDISNADRVRTWRGKMSDLRPVINELNNAAGLAEQAARDDKFRIANPSTAGEHCKHCPGRLECDAFDRYLGNALDAAAEDVFNDAPVAFKAAQLRIVKRALIAIKAKHDALNEHLTTLATIGQDVPGLQMKPGRSRKIWKESIDTVVAIGDSCGTDLRKKVELVTPTQARKMGAPAELIEALSETVPGAMSLEEIDMREITRLFSKEQ